MSITLVLLEFQQYELTKYACEKTLEHITPDEILVISDKDFVPGSQWVYRDPVTDYREYNSVMLKEVAPHVNTDFALYTQFDGIAHNKTNWTDDFLNYDYIGAVWPWEPEGRNVGNGGFSLRSKKMLDACLDNNVCLSEPPLFTAEDTLIGSTYRDYLEKTHSIKFAPTELAKKFSFELGTYESSFGFHGLWNVFNLMSDSDIDFYAERINYQNWNQYKWHHVLAALIRRNRLDIYEHMVEQLVQNSPEYLNFVAEWLEQDSHRDNTKLVIN